MKLRQPKFKWDWHDVEAAMQASVDNPEDPYQQLRDVGVNVDDVMDAMRADPTVTREQISSTLGGILLGILLCQQDH